MTIEVRNPIQEGMTLEMIWPSDTITFTVEHAFNEEGEKIDVFHGGAGKCLIPYPQDPGEFVFFREKLEGVKTISI